MKGVVEGEKNGWGGHQTPGGGETTANKTKAVLLLGLGTDETQGRRAVKEIYTSLGVCEYVCVPETQSPQLSLCILGKLIKRRPRREHGI